jgi:uncharacterized protein YndB with AHSA1/START domain
MAEATSSCATGQARQELILTRIFGAPGSLVFRAWTDPQHMAHCWGPCGFTTTTHSMDVRAGGEWRFVTHGPDGADYKNRRFYLEVVKPERLVSNHFGEEGEQEEKLETTATFLDRGKTTEVLLCALFPTAEAGEFVVEKHRATEG